MERTLYLSLAPHRIAQRIAETDPKVLVVTPNTRAADSLKASGRSLGDLAISELSWNQTRPASVLVARRALREAVHAALDVGDPAGYAAAIEPAIRAMYRAGIDLDALARFASPPVRRLALVANAYRAYLRRRNWIDPAETLREAAAAVRIPRRVLVAGYPWLSPEEIAFLEEIAAPGSTVCLPASPHAVFSENLATAEHLAARGWRIIREEGAPAGVGEWAAARYLGVTSETKSIEAVTCPNLEAEVRVALRQVKELLVEGAEPAEIVVIVRDEKSYGPIALDVAWEYGLPLRALYAIPLTETRLGAWLQLAMEAAQRGFPFEPTLRLLAHPLGPGLEPAVWEAVRQQCPNELDAWTALGINLAPFGWPPRAQRGDYVSKLRSLLQTLEVGEKAGHWAREAIAAERLTDALGDLADPADEMLNFRAFVAAVNEVLTLLTVPVAPGRGGVELHTPLSVWGARYRYVFILGLAEGLLPRPPADDPFLDFHARKQLARAGFPFEIPAEAARREELSFWFALLAAEQRLIVSYPRLLAAREALPSPFLQRLGLPRDLPEGSRGNMVASPEEAWRVQVRRTAPTEDAALAAARHAWRVERRRESNAPPDEYDGIVGLPLDPRAIRFSASRIIDLGQCPFKWFAGAGLRLTEPTEAETDLSYGLRGILYHHTLHLALREAAGEANPRAAALAGLEAAFRQAEAEIPLPPLPAWETRRASHLNVLRQAIQGADFLREDATILSGEQCFSGEWRGLRVTGRVDRIDRQGENLLLIDYKTSGSKSPGAKDAEGKATLDVQIPLYCEAAAPTLYPGPMAAQGYYYSLTKAKTIAVDEPDDAALNALVDRIKQHLTEGRYPVEPDVDRRACTYCSFDLLCRKGPRLDRKG